MKSVAPKNGLARLYQHFMCSIVIKYYIFVWKESVVLLLIWWIWLTMISGTLILPLKYTIKHIAHFQSKISLFTLIFCASKGHFWEDYILIVRDGKRIKEISFTFNLLFGQFKWGGAALFMRGIKVSAHKKRCPPLT